MIRMLGATAIIMSLTGAFLTTLLIVTILPTGIAVAQDSGTRTLDLTPSRNSGVSGTATFARSGGSVKVQLSLQGLPKDGVQHLAHIHVGATCTDERTGTPAPVEFSLKSIVAQGRTGSSTTEVSNITLDQLFDDTPRYVDVHAEQAEENVPPSIVCADLIPQRGNGVYLMPGTGGSSVMSMLAVGGMILMSLGATVGYLLQRRMI